MNTILSALVLLSALLSQPARAGDAPPAECTDFKPEAGDKSCVAMFLPDKKFRVQFGQSSGTPKWNEYTDTCGLSDICIAGSAVQLIVTPPRLPPGKLRASFDSRKGEHAELLWDPLVSSGRLVRSLILGPGIWQVSFRSDAIYQGTAPKDFSWKSKQGSQFVEGDSLKADTFVLDPNIFEDKTGDSLGHRGKYPLWENGELVQVQFTAMRRLSISKQIEAFAADAGGFAGGPGVGLSGRSALPGNLDQQALEAASVIASVVLDRAKQKLLSSLSDTLQDDLCGAQSEDAQAKAPRSEDAPARLSLPHTCALLKHTKLDTLVSSPDVLVRSLVADLLDFIQPLLARPREQVKRKLSVQNQHSLELAMMDVLSHDLISFIRDSLIAGHLQNDVGPLLISSLAGVVRESYINGADEGGGDKPDQDHSLLYPLYGKSSGDVCAQDSDCAAKVVVGIVFAAAAYCHSQGGCDARQVVEVLSAPESLFFMGDGWATQAAHDKFRKFIKSWSRASSLVLNIQQVMSPPRSATNVELMGKAIDVGFELLRAGLCFSGSSDIGTCLQDDAVGGAAASASATVSPTPQELIASFHILLSSIARRDVAAALPPMLELTRILESWIQRLTAELLRIRVCRSSGDQWRDPRQGKRSPDGDGVERRARA